MSFYASEFIYNGVPSSNFGLTISDTNVSDELSLPGANVSIISQEIYRKPKVYLFGVKQTPVLTIPISIFKYPEITAEEASVVSKWLFGQMDYKKLQIVQPDMQNIYYNCILTDPQIIKIGNIIRGFRATITCDSPYAWEFPKKIRYNYPFNNYYIETVAKINNSSDSPDYIYPKMNIAINIFGGSVKLINHTDNNRIFEITNLEQGEVLDIDNNMQTLKSSFYINHLKDLYNYNWFRYVPGLNYVTISGNIEYVEFINEFPRKVV
jgi:hypothetical protein